MRVMKIYCLGKNYNLPAVKDLIKDFVVRGTYEEQEADYESFHILVTCWKGNKLVILASNYIGCESAVTANGCDKKQKKKISTASPKIVEGYTILTGGDDLMDSFLGGYRIKIKSRK